MIWWPFNMYEPMVVLLNTGRNSPMIWWPFNKIANAFLQREHGVTHQWSGDLSMKLLASIDAELKAA